MTASGISTIGSRMTFVAIPWLVLETTGSPSKMGLVAAAEMIPYVLVSVLGGALMDRVGSRRTAIVSDLASVAMMAGIALGHRLGFGVLIALVFVAGGLRGLGDNSRKVMVLPLAKASGTSMARVAAMMDGMNRLTMMLGASIAGVLIAWTDATTVLLIDAGTFAVAAAIVAISASRDLAGVSAGRREPYFKAVKAGFLHVWRDGIAFGMLAIIFVINVCNQASGVVFIPLWADKIAGSSTAVGLVIGALGLGAVVGNVLFTILATRVPRHATLTVAFLIGGPPRFLALGLSENLAAVLMVTFVSGMAVAAINPILGVAFIDRTPDEMWPRVQGLMTGIAMAGLPLGGLLGGWSAQAWGLEVALLLTSALYLTVALVPVFGYRSWRSINRAPTLATANA